MKIFVQQHAKDVTGVLSGFDRLVLRGTVRQLAYVDGMRMYLAIVGVLLKDFGRHVQEVSTRVKESVMAWVTEHGRPIIYLPSSGERKDLRARALAAADGLQEGPIGLFTCVEPCVSFDIHRNREQKRLELVRRWRKCLFLYLYQIHPVVGFMHVRMQSWFPFGIQVYLNGREWLARELDRRSLSYQRRENCFTWLADPAGAQRLMDAQLRIAWPRLLDSLIREVHPLCQGLLSPYEAHYYWTVHQSEWASDVLFRSRDALSRLYPRLVEHGLRTFGSDDVMRFLGHKVPVQGRIDPRFQGEVISDLKGRPEGIRIKHRVNGNSIKLYDKQGNVLRFETTLNQPGDLKVFRPKEGGARTARAWRPLRRGVADLHRRAAVSQAANDRYAEALAAVGTPQRLGDLTERLCQPAKLEGRRVRGLRPWAGDDLALLRAVGRGEFLINGLRNRDLAKLLYPTAPASSPEQRRRSARISRLLRLLRAHRILKKVPKTHRYQVTDAGRRAIAALLAAHAATTDQLTGMAA
jgi:hypothetical protein